MYRKFYSLRNTLSISRIALMLHFVSLKCQNLSLTQRLGR